MKAPGPKLVLTRSSTLAVFALSAALFSCNPSAAGSAGEKDKPPPIALARPSDQALEGRLTGIFAQIDELGSVRAHVREGVVHLTGTTETASSEGRATALANRLDGVVYVRSDIAQPASARGVVSAIWRRLRRVGQGALRIAPNLVAALAVFAPFQLLSRLLRRWEHPFRLFHVRALTGHILRVLLRVISVLVGAVIALEVLGVLGIVGAVVGALGVLGVVAGFVFKDSVSTFLPGMMLGLRPPFKAGELIRIGGHEGRVVRITPSATVLVTTDAEELRIPNSEFFNGALINYSHHRSRRLRFRIALAPEADLGRVEELGCGALLDVRAVQQEPPPFLRVSALGETPVEVEFFAWVNQDEASFRDVESRAKRAVLEVLMENGVPLAATTIIVSRPPQARTRSSGRASSANGAEALDRDFVNQHFERVYAERGEQDLLEAARPPAKAH